MNLGTFGRARVIAPLTTLALVGVLLTAACDETGDTRTTSRSIDPDGATSALVRVEMGAGKLKIGGGGSALLDADFTYNVEDWEPRVNYEVVDERGEVRLRQPDGDVNIFDMDDVVYHWDLQLSDDLPTELEVEMGAGRSTLDLGGTTVTDLRVETGAGSATVDLTGEWQHDLTGKIEAGAGKMKVIVPKDVSVRIETDRGVADIDRSGFDKDGDVYTNAAYGTTDVTIDLEVKAGAGEIDLEVAE